MSFSPPFPFLSDNAVAVFGKVGLSVYRLNENMAQAQKLLIKSGHDREQIKRITICDNLLFIETPAGETT
ncbi:MAG: hypothetical protein AAFN08_02830, partial [Cyanobacteria bacterium J06559_3]